MSEPRKAKTIAGLFFVLMAFAVYMLAQSSNGNRSGSGGSGTVTHTAGNLTLNCNVVGNGVADLKCSAVTTDDGTTFTSAGTGGILASAGPIASGANGGAAGVLKGFGSTSGSGTITFPAAAGTSTNGIVVSNNWLTPDGTASLPAWAFSAHTANGIAWNAGLTAPCIVSSGTNIICFVGLRLRSNDAGLGFSNSTDAAGSIDTNVSRSAGAVIAVGSGASGDTTGKLKAAGYMSVGTTFTTNAGCTDSALTGGATAGKFTIGQGTACTTIITMGNTATAPNGWSCTAYDQTTVPTVAIRQTASTATTASLLMTGTTNDVITFACIGY